MHSLLESYLAEVQAQLGALPATRREEELREMRQHLLNATIVNRERGQTEDEAAATAIIQFGTSEEASRCFIRAWQKEKARGRRDCWKTAAFTLGLCFAVQYPIPEVAFGGHGWPAWLVSIEIYGYDFIVQAVIGMIAGLVFPRKAMAGAAIGVTSWLIFITLRATQNIQAINQTNPHFVNGPAKVDWNNYVIGCIYMIMASATAASLSSLWRRTKMGRRAVVAE